MTQATYTNHLLIAMPALTDSDFAHSVTLVCEHSAKGALGIILNKPSPMVLRDVLSQMKLEARDEAIGKQTVLCGGPMRTDRGFVLHRPGGDWDSTHRVSELIQVTTSRDVLAAMARGEGPGDAYVALGFAPGMPMSWSARSATTPGCRCPPMSGCCSSCRSRSAGRPPGSSSAWMWRS